MRFGVDFFQSFYAYMGISLCCRKARVPQQFLHYADIAAGIHKVRGETVAKAVGMNIFIQV
jgi:hypothetical protein